VSLAVENGTLSSLSFHFWNWWPLLASFVQRLEQQRGAPLVVLHERL
jgi:hypothetical protein